VAATPGGPTPDDLVTTIARAARGDLAGGAADWLGTSHFVRLELDLLGRFAGDAATVCPGCPRPTAAAVSDRLSCRALPLLDMVGDATPQPEPCAFCDAMLTDRPN
jgi:hypothetical protein